MVSVDELLSKVVDCGGVRHDKEHGGVYQGVVNSSSFRDFIRNAGVREIYCLDDLALRDLRYGERYCDVYLDTERGDFLIDFKLCISTGASAVEDLEDKLRGSVSLIGRVLKRDVSPKYLIVVLPSGHYGDFKGKLIRKLRLKVRSVRFIRESQALELGGELVVIRVRKDDRDDAVKIDNAVLGGVMRV